MHHWSGGSTAAKEIQTIGPPRQRLQPMSPLHRPNSEKRPCEMVNASPSGTNVPVAMEMMVESMVKMMQSARSQESSDASIRF